MSAACDHTTTGLIDLVVSRLVKHYPGDAGEVRQLDFRKIFGRAATFGNHTLVVIIKTCLGSWRTSTRLGRVDEGCPVIV